MTREMTTEQLTDSLEQFLKIRCEGVQPEKLNLRFCPTLESCDGPARSAVFRFRTYAWMSILENTGLLNNFFRSIGLLDLLGVDFIPMINTPGAVVLGMVYNYLPFMIMPIQSVIVKLDKSLIEAAQDLGCHPALVFRKVIFPLSLPGVLSGITMVFVPCVSTFIISDLLGGGNDGGFGFIHKKVSPFVDIISEYMVTSHILKIKKAMGF